MRDGSARGALVLILRILAVASLLLAGCAPSNTPTREANPVEKAAAEATALIERAQATALVLHAQGTATALIQGSDARTREPASFPEEEPEHDAPAGTPAPPSAAEADAAVRPSASPEGKAAATESTESSAVVLLRVEIGRETGLISVQYTAPPRVAGRWWQGSVSVTDEATGTVYNEIPVLPIVGPLISRPIRAGQFGYVMLANAPTPLAPGAVVTVVLGEYKFEHQTVQG